MGKTYTVSFDSTSNYGGANNNKRTYVANWESILPPGKEFKVSFTFMSAATAIVNNTIMTLHVDLGQATSFASLGAVGNGSFSSNRYVGYLLIGTDSVSKYYFSTTTTNPPIYIKDRPPSGTIEVELHQGLSTTLNYIDPVPSNYVLTLFFEEL